MSEFLIIGGGINGLLLARELSSTGAEVGLVEKGECAREASWAGGGIVSPLYPWRYQASVTKLASWAQDFYPQLARELREETGIDTEFQQCGLLMLDADDEAEALTWAELNSRKIERLDTISLYRRETRLAPGFSSALLMPDVANIRNPRLGKAMVGSLRQRSNVKIREGCEVVDFNCIGEKINSVLVVHSGVLWI